MTDFDDVNMRYLLIFALASMIVAVAMIPADMSEAERPADYPTELVELQYWDGHTAHIVYVFPNRAIDASNIPAPPANCSYWVRSDTREVVTSETVFAPGTYLITPYSWVPEPWGDTPSSSGQDDTLPTVAIVMSAVAIITAVAAIIMIRKK